MAEALAVIGIVSSIASLIDLAVQITERIRDFTTRTSEVPESFRSLEKRLPLLTATVRLIQQQANAGRFPPEVTIALRSLIQSTSTQLRIVRQCLSKITPPSDASRFHRAVKALQSLTKDGNVRAAVEKIHQDIDFLVLHQTTQHVDASDQILAALAQLQRGQTPALSLSHDRGHEFGNVAVSGHAVVQLGDNYHVYQSQQASTLKTFGLCITSAPLIEPDSFVGRVRELEKIAQILQPGEPAIEQRQVILGGLGGMGKTQLAVAYARKCHASYTSVLWLNATSELTLMASFRAIAEALLIEPLTHELDDKEALKTVFRWLSDERNKQWLLIYDNYDEPDKFPITNYMATTPNGSIIVTTRLPDHIQDPHARRLAQRLEGLPLALATAGAYLRKTTLTFGQYLEAYEKRFDINPRQLVQLQEYNYTLYTTWNLSYSQIERNDPNAARVLQLLAYFDNQEVWFELLHAGLKDGLPMWLQETAEEHIDFENVMSILVDYCLLEVHATTRSYSMHSCVHDWALRALNREIDPQLYWYAFDCVRASIDNNDWEALGQVKYGRVSQHGVRLTYHRFITCDDFKDGLSERLNEVIWIATMLHGQVQLSAAEQMYSRALARQEKALGLDHIETLRIIDDLANLYRDQSKLDQAEQMYQRALAGREKALGPNDTTTLNTISNLGDLYRTQGKLNEAEQIYLRALARCEKALGLDHISTLNTVNNLGNLYADQGKLKEAEQMYVRALVETEKVLGFDHISTLRTVNNLGILYTDQGKLKKAERMLLRALAGYEEALRSDHTLTLDTISNLGNLYLAQGKFNEAEQMYVRALVGKEKVLGPDHTSTLDSKFCLANLYRKQGQLDQAESIYQQLLIGYEAAFGDDHPSKMLLVHNFGLLYEAQDRLDEAEGMYQRALVEYQKRLGFEHWRTRDVADALGQLSRRQTRTKEVSVDS